jgi:hypothetical protein
MEEQILLFRYIPISAIIVLISGIIGYFIKYYINKRLQKLNRTLEYIDKQINEFYWPLYVFTNAGKTLFNEIFDKCDKTGFVENSGSKKPVLEWRLWVEEIFIPMNEKIEKLIFEKSHLVVEDTIDPCFIEFLDHSAQYKVLVKQWSLDVFLNFHTEKKYPKALKTYIEDRLAKLRKEQRRIREKLLLLNEA